MTLVETAMARAKARALERGQPDAAGKGSRRPENRSTEPVARIRPHVLSIDAQACRENRLLIPGAADKDAAAVAAYRMLRTRILHRVRARNWVTIGVTSASPNDGKTLTAINLSLSLAREKNSEVVLLDLDMRNPSVCRCLGIEPDFELRNFFEKKTELEHVFFSMIGVENLLLSGNTSPAQHASELLSSTRFEELIQHIKDRTTNPIVLIDLPPVLTTDDALVLAPRLDAILMVAAQGRTERADIEKAMGLLTDFPIAGLVLNRSTEAAHYYGDGYGSDYGSS
jgi:protein-tyrosine kinase